MGDSDTAPLLYEQHKQQTFSSSTNTPEGDTSIQYGSLSDTQGISSDGTTDITVPNEQGISNEKERLYKSRWYIVVLFALLAAVQMSVWNTWGPISHTAEAVFGWNDADISLLANWGPITFMLGMPVFAWMMDAKGLRVCMVITVLCLGLGCGIRLIPTQQPSMLHRWLINFGQILNGIGGPVCTSAMAPLSSQWFPPNERTTATAIPLIIKFLALAGSYIIGPILVPDVSNLNQNHSDINSTMFSFEDYAFIGESANHSNISGNTAEELKKDIYFYLELQAGAAGVLLVLILLYFPSKPPTPPCRSAALKREDFLPGLKLLAVNGNFWILALVSFLVGGFSSAWMSVLSLNLKTVDVSQKEAGWIGFYSFLLVGTGMLILARLSDYFARGMKWYISGLYLISSSMYLWFALMCIKVAPFSMVSLYLSLLIAQTPPTACAPLFYELACEVAYPVGEGTASIVLTFTTQLATIVFLFIMMIPNVGSMWLNWALLGAVASGTVLILLLRERHQRLDIDVEQSLSNKKEH
ncbi:solute carrier family 49 member 4 homolog [Haliotis rufescens]|uniref:solute carrier family 49 member 4 homolog n=1 Tax=Haliotis rufescens TaxID=6454 RepID=UPI00201F2A86|nr:solute carrier family 49 member 4 homolog [Haliotis rufescens]